MKLENNGGERGTAGQFSGLVAHSPLRRYTLVVIAAETEIGKQCSGVARGAIRLFRSNDFMDCPSTSSCWNGAKRMHRISNQGTYHF